MLVFFVFWGGGGGRATGCLAACMHQCRYAVVQIRARPAPCADCLLNAWDEWGAAHPADNDTDRPFNFAEDQLYVVMSFHHGGQDLEGYHFGDMGQARAVVAQVCASLAVAEEAMGFEHRDLHVSNVLVKPCDEEYMEYELAGECFRVATHGVRAAIIDYTLSRLETVRAFTEPAAASTCCCLGTLALHPLQPFIAQTRFRSQPADTTAIV